MSINWTYIQLGYPTLAALPSMLNQEQRVKGERCASNRVSCRIEQGFFT
jgi:hypothetical protein